MKKSLLSLVLAGMFTFGCGASSSSLVSAKLVPKEVQEKETSKTEDRKENEIESGIENEMDEEKREQRFFKKVQEGLKNQKDYLENSLVVLKEIMLIQENELGISYQNMGVRLEVCPSDVPEEWLALYFPQRNTICLQTKFMKVVSSEFEKKEQLSGEKLETLIKSPSQAKNAFQQFVVTLSHELGHLYADQRSEQLGKGDWVDFSPYQHFIGSWLTLEEFYGLSKYQDRLFARKVLTEYQETHQVEITQVMLLNMVSEGIGEYFGSLGYAPNMLTDHYFPNKVQEILPEDEAVLWRYPLGYHLVKPLIDTFGIKGIDYIITHLPKSTGNLSQDAVQYRKQAMEELENE
ncbi:hypothetical protein HYX13_03400 [Candidatus Woesearchaeota archaeon]|nr:hypothetical protein [Candidatus Woesearchaeota archaeon]